MQNIHYVLKKLFLQISKTKAEDPRDNQQKTSAGIHKGGYSTTCKKGFNLIITRKMQIKTTRRNHYAPIGIDKILQNW